MQTFGLFVDFDSLAEALGSQGLPVDYDRIARGLKEMAEVFGELTHHQVHGTWSLYPEQNASEGKLSLDARTVFTRYNYEFGNPGIDELAESLDDLIIEDTCPHVVVIATGVAESSRLIRTIERLQKTQRSVVLWYVDGVVSSDLLEKVPQTKSIQGLLNIRAIEAALLVDLENVVISLRDKDYLLDYSKLARGMREHAEKMGLIVTEAHAFADFDRLPDLPGPDRRSVSAMTAFVKERFQIHHIPHTGKDTADMLMAEEGNRLLKTSKSPAVFVIASGDKGFYSLVQGVKGLKKRAIVWGVEGATSRELIDLAGDGNFVYIHDFIEFSSSTPVPATPSMSDFSEDKFFGSSLESEMGPIPRYIVPLKVITLMEGGGLSWIPFRKLMQDLSLDTILFPFPESAREAINLAIDEGTLLKNSLPNPRVPGSMTTTLEPCRGNSAVQTALNIVTRIITLLKNMQNRMPFVAFSYFSRSLSSDPTICNLNLTEIDSRNWLNYLIREDAIQVSKEDNPTNPEFRVSTIRLNPNHPLTQAISCDISASSEEFQVRIILTLDHYLTQKGTPWIPMSSLRTKLERFGRLLMEQAISELHTNGALNIEKYNNPQKDYKTTGCSLILTNEQVHNVLETRKDILNKMHDLLQRYTAVPSGLLEDRVKEIESIQKYGLDAHRWLDILADDGLIKLQRGNAESPVVYVLTDSDPVIQKLFPEPKKATIPVDGDFAWLATLAETHGHS